MSADSVSMESAADERSRSGGDWGEAVGVSEGATQTFPEDRIDDDVDDEGADDGPFSPEHDEQTDPDLDGTAERLAAMGGADDMSGLTKAAVFILSLNEDAATSVLRSLSDEELSLVAGEIAQIGVVDRETVGAVMEQFLEIREATEIVYEGGVDPASRLLESSLSSERAGQLTELLAARVGGKRFAFLSEVDAASIVACLEEERPQTIAVVLAQMSSARAADVLERLPVEQRKDVIRRIAAMDGASHECVQLIEQVLRKHFEGARFSSLGERGGVKAAAEILRAAEEQGVSSFFDDLREEKPDLAEKVSKYLFDFKDLERFDDQFLSRALKRVDVRDLALALKSSEPKLVGKVSKNLSRSEAEQLRESVERLGAVRLSEVEAARSLVLERILSLEDGERTLSAGNVRED